MKKSNRNLQDMLPGQITLWDMEITRKAEKITEKPILFTKTEVLDTKIAVSFTELPSMDTSIKNDKFSNPLESTVKQHDFLDKNKIFENDNLSRVIKYYGGCLGIELQYENSYKTLYVNTEGVEEFTFDKKLRVLPMDEIQYYKSPEGRFNNTQEEKLKEVLQQYPSGKVIRRKADENIIIELQDKVISINSIGWVLEFQGCKSVYKEDEVICQNPPEEIDIEVVRKSVKLGDIVEAQHGQRLIQGEIVHVYGPGNVTLNLVFDEGTKHTAVHRSRVTKLIKCA